MSDQSLIRRASSHPGPESATHLYIVGQPVRLKGGVMQRFQAAAIYHITGTMPPSGDSPQYRIRNDEERHERVAIQDDLEPVDSCETGQAPLGAEGLSVMAKGQKRSNREIRKPKQEKAAPKPESLFGAQDRPAAKPSAPRIGGKP